MEGIHWCCTKGLGVGGENVDCKKLIKYSFCLTFTGDFEGDNWEADIMVFCIFPGQF